MLTILQDGRPTKARTKRNPGHFWADNEIVEEYLPNLSIYAFSIYMLLCYYTRSTTGRSFPSIKALAKQLKVSEPTIRKGLNELSETRLIAVTPNFKETKAGKTVMSNYTYTLSEINRRSEGGKPGLGGKPHLPGGGVNQVDPLNEVDQGGKPGLGGGVNGDYLNKNNKNKMQ